MRMSGRCGEAFWRVLGGCLEGVVRLSGDLAKLSGGCVEALWRVW